MVIAVDLPARDRALATVVTARARGHDLATVIEIVVMGRGSVAAVASVDVDAEDHAGARFARSVSIMSSRSTIKMSRACTAISPIAVRLSHDARPAPARAISAAWGSR